MDLISRRAAIDALKRDEEYDEDIPNRADGVRDAIITIIGLPSAQPSLKDAVTVIRGFFSKGKFNYTSEFETEDRETLYTDWGYFEDGLDEIERYIESRDDVPSAQPEVLACGSGELIARSEPQWIPCSERLPEHDGEKYLVTLYSDRINVVSVRISYCYMNRDGFWSDVPVGYKVTAWMPLPEPWKGEQP